MASLKAPPVVITGVSNGRRYSVTVRLTHGLHLRVPRLVAGNAAVPPSLEATVVVASSNLPGCGVGATGTVTITNGSSVVPLAVCGGLFAGGHEQASAVIEAA